MPQWVDEVVPSFLVVENVVGDQQDAVEDVDLANVPGNGFQFVV